MYNIMVESVCGKLRLFESSENEKKKEKSERICIARPYGMYGGTKFVCNIVCFSGRNC